MLNLFVIRMWYLNTVFPVFPGSYPKTKPPPLLSMHNLKPPSHRPTAPHSLLPSRTPSVSHGPSFSPQPSRGPAVTHSLDKPQPLLGPAPTHRPSPTRAPLLDTPPLGFQSSRGLLQHPGSHALLKTPLICGPPPQNGPRGPRVPPPSLRSLHMGASPGQHILMYSSLFRALLVWKDLSLIFLIFLFFWFFLNFSGPRPPRRLLPWFSQDTRLSHRPILSCGTVVTFWAFFFFF